MAKFTLPGQGEASEAKAFVIEQFGTLNTKATRPAIADNEFSWLENWIPLGDGNMRTLYGDGETLYEPAPGRTVVYEYAFNFGNTSYKAFFLDNGTAYQVRDSDGAVTTISASAGKFYTAGGDLPACAQWQSKYLMIASTVTTNGYWLWNGADLFGSGGLSPDVTILDSGLNYSSAPSVTARGGSGSGATFTATVANGSVTDVVVTNPGSGYLINDQVVLTFSGGGSDATAAGVPTITTSSGGLYSIIVTNPGSGYSADAVVTIAGGGGSGAQAIVASAVNGQITSITVTNAGSGYTSPPTIGITASTGSGFVATARTKTGQITSIAVAVGGSGYTAPPIVSITGDGTGAEAVANLTAGAVSSITVTNPGLGYSYARVTLDGGNNSASAVISLMPFGIKGNTIETYQGHVWVGDTTKVSFTGPNSTSDFSTAGGGGSFPATDSFLRARITRLIQSNGFLYVFADSSINVISNVNTSISASGLSALTTFNNSNVDAQTGTAWRDSVIAFGRAVVFANPTGVYALYGGAAEKVSSQLDGLFAGASFNTDSAGITPTGGVFNLFGIRVYGFLFTTSDSFSGSTRNLIGIWDGQKWFMGSCLKEPDRIFYQEIDSELTLWGNNGDEVYPLFQVPSSDLLKVFQTKLRSDSKLFVYKQVNRFYIMAFAQNEQPEEIEITLDTESSTNVNAVSISLVGSIIFFNQPGVTPLTFIGAGSVPINWTTGALGITGSVVSTYGRLVGVTGQTYAEDVTLIHMAGIYTEHAPYA